METRNEGLRTCGRPSRGRYAQGCRCYMCRVANSEYELARSRGELGRSMATRDQTASCRSRVNRLVGAGWSLRQICEVSGVPRSSLRSLMRGHRNSQVSRRGKRAGERVTHSMSLANYRAIMALPERPETADGALVDGTALARGVRAAVASGRSCCQIARDAGIGPQAVYRLRDSAGGCMVTRSTFAGLAPVLLGYAGVGA